MIGSVVDGIEVRDRLHLADMVVANGDRRIDSLIDVPVAPGFERCCPLIVIELSRMQ